MRNRFIADILCFLFNDMMRMRRSPLLTALAAISIGLSGALVVALLKLVDSNHQEPVSVVYGYIGATFFWFALVGGIWLAWKRHLR